MAISQDLLQDLFDYNQDTGEFIRRVSVGSRGQAGAVAGSVDGHGYVDIMINRKLYKAHRLAFLYMGGSFPLEEVDHINGVRGDNRWANLRPVTRQENMQNRKRGKEIIPAA